MPLSSANVVQAKTGQALGQNPVSITLDNPTGAGNTVTVELFGPAVYPTAPDGWDYDLSSPGFAPVQWNFHRAGIPAGESSWDFTYIVATDWIWRVTEWDTALDAVDPLEQTSTGSASGLGVTSLSTGTTPTTVRAEVVALAMLSWAWGGTSAQAFDFGAWTSSFTERDEARVSGTNVEYDLAWAWLFADTSGSFGTTATITTTPDRSATYAASLVVYAASQPLYEAVML